jgi:hypothetical protein
MKIGEVTLTARQKFRMLIESFKFPVREREAFVKYFESLIRGVLDVTDARVDAALSECRRHIEARR